VEASLTPRAMERVSREAAQKSFDEAAKSLNLDWGTQWDGKQIQRWGEAIGDRMVRERDAEASAYQRGHRPACPANQTALLVIGVDGGRVQTHRKNEETGSRWREDKVCTVSSYIPGDGSDERPPQKLLTTHVATMRECEPFGKLARIEAERRGIRAAVKTIFLGDCGNWIDPLHDREFPATPRIADYEHAVEHLWEGARAALGKDSPLLPQLAHALENQLYHGRVNRLIERLEAEASKLGPVEDEDGAEHPRRVLAGTIGYFRRNKDHMNYPEYRRRGWPIGSGNTEAGVKQFNKRVKGTEQFWSEPGVEAILALRGVWISQDQRWQRYWNSRAAYN
jgi:hypothetical protein